MKMTLDWHIECLATRRKNYEHDLTSLRKEEERVRRFGEENVLYGQQIAAAVRMKKDGFDRDKFLKNRGA
jgi:hypothetical protein